MRRTTRQTWLSVVEPSELRQTLDGRRGEVFPLRVTEHEWERIETVRAQAGGPRAIGPWLLWSALYRGIDDTARPGRAIPARAGITNAIAGAGITSPARSSGNTASMGGALPPAEKRTILDLCGGSGAWSAPYVAAGYHVVRVTLPEHDVRTFAWGSPVCAEPVWGVLAAPPCDQFSLARNGHPEIPRDIERGLEIVGACLRVIHQVQPRWWALENPVGLLSRWLGTPLDVWDPCDFGDPWTKRTAVWGSYSIPRRGPYVQPLGGGPLCTICDPERRSTTWCSNSAHRAITPAGFARAFYEANP